jgi:hypothetical protein
MIKNQQDADKADETTLAGLSTPAVSGKRGQRASSASALAIARQTVHHNRSHQSYLVMPVRSKD